MIEKRDFYINGAWVAPAQAHDFEVIDPSTEEACAVISLGDKADTTPPLPPPKPPSPHGPLCHRLRNSPCSKSYLKNTKNALAI